MRVPEILQAFVPSLYLYVGLKSDLFRLKIQANIPRDFLDCETAWLAERAAECSLIARN